MDTFIEEHEMPDGEKVSFIGVRLDADKADLLFERIKNIKWESE